MRAALVVVVAVSTVLVAGCGARVQPGTPPETPPCPTPAQVTLADNGQTVCASVGGKFTVKLPDDGKGHWSAITSDSDAVDVVLLTGSPPISGTQADFVARHKGTAHLTASRPVCPSASPGAMSCKSLQAFTVTVTVP
jgi:hypothetical protein